MKMKDRIVWLMIMVIVLAGTAVAAKTVLVISDANSPGVVGGEHWDDTLVTWLESIGYVVDTSGMNGAYQEGNTPFGDPAALSAFANANLIFISVTLDEGDYDADRKNWNELEVPILVNGTKDFVEGDGGNAAWGWSTGGDGGSDGGSNGETFVQVRPGTWYNPGDMYVVDLWDWTDSPEDPKAPEKVRYIDDTLVAGGVRMAEFRGDSDKQCWVEYPKGADFDAGQTGANGPDFYGVAGAPRVYFSHWRYAGDVNEDNWDSYQAPAYKEMLEEVLNRLTDTTIDAGPDQQVQLYDVTESTGYVELDSTILQPITEDYSYAWTSDPSDGVVITTASGADPTVTFTTVGVYVLSPNAEGTVTDDLGPDTVTITVVEPTIDAGPDQQVQLYDAKVGTGSVALNSTLNDAMTEDYTYAWTSDPSDGVVITAASDENPTVTFTTADVYVLSPNVSGTLSGPLNPDTVTITVVEPTIDAGGPRTVTLRDALTSVILDSTLNDTLIGEDYTYAWSSVPGVTYLHGSETAADPNVAFATDGVYLLTLDVTGTLGTFTSDTATVTVTPPYVDAGPDRTVTLRNALISVVLDSTLFDTLIGETYTYAWSSVPGVTYLHGSETAADPNITFATDGVYLLTLDVSGDINGPLDANTVTITVTPPSVDAGDDQTVGLRDALENIVLNPTLVQPLIGEVYTYTWSCPSGAVTFSDNGLADPNIAIAAHGVYLLTLQVDGDLGTDMSDTLTIYVNSEATWVGSTGGDWHATGPTNWTDPNRVPIGVPDASIITYLGDDAEPIGVEVVVNINAAAHVYSISVADDPNNPYTVNVNTGGSITTVGDLNIAPDSAQVGIVHLFSGAPLTVGDDLRIGDSGIGTLSALESSVIDIDDRLEIGDDDGTFVMTGGTLTVGGEIQVSRDIGGMGTMTLTTVTVNAGDDIKVASNGDDTAGTGIGTLTVTDSDVNIDNDLRVGAYGDGDADVLRGTLTIGDHLIIASNGSANGDGTVILTDVVVTTTDLRVGEDGTGTITVTGGTLTIGDDIEIASGDKLTGDGSVTLTDVVVTVSDSLDIAATGDNASDDSGTGVLEVTGTTAITGISGDLRIGNGTGGDGTLIMRNFSSITCDGNIEISRKQTSVGVIDMYDNAYLHGVDEMVIADSGSTTGTVNLNGPDTELYLDNNLVVGDDGIGTLNVTGGTVYVDNDLMVAQNNGSVSSINMVGGSIFVWEKVRFASDDNGSLDAVGNLHMESGAEFTHNEDSRDKDKRELRFARYGTSEVIIEGGSKLYAYNYNDNLSLNIAENEGCYANVEVKGVDTEIYTKKDMWIANEGGTVDLLIDNYGKITVDRKLDIASDSDDDGLNPGIANITMTDNAYFYVYDDIDIGGQNSSVEIDLQNGKIFVDNGDSILTMPEGASGTGYARIILGKDVSGLSAGDATLELDGTLDASDAGANDYIDFLAGGLLIMEDNEITAQEIEAHIASGYFRTSYSQATLYGATPVTGIPGVAEEIAIVYEDKGDNYEIELGIRLIPTVCVTPSGDIIAGDITGDCIVDMYDIAALSAGWDDIYGLTELGGIATAWLDIGELEFGSLPTPNPATFASAPAATWDATIISMTATTGYHPSDTIQYYFTCTEGGGTGGTDSGWQTDPTYIDDGLTTENTYTYTVKMRGQTEGYVGDESGPESALAVSPPATWDSVPTPGGDFQVVDSYGFETPDQGWNGYEYRPSGSVWTFTGGGGLSGRVTPWKCNSTSPDPLGNQFTFMQGAATISKDLTGLTIDQTYQLSFFESYRTAMSAGNDLSVIIDEGLPTEVVIYNNPGVTNATWQARTTSQFVAAKTSYTLTFRTTNPLGGDRSTIIDGVEVKEATYGSETTITMTATTLSDPSGVEYYFTCTAGPGNNSDDWQDSEEYVDTGLSSCTEYTYTVTARDKSIAQNETSPSTAESATTTGCP